MKKEYKSPTIELVPFMVEGLLCSSTTLGGDYNPFPDDFDSDSD